ncbi:unnamed protein product [Brachionus calyciflorus]|uniref:SWIM-type domain-containing protein n=1 Tax=Brachionus calyciflorus TaxID=104777 RepID=A0A813M4J1_9BILA|nr:unnamed protein product [Brachionus calyciflorus]
MTSKKKSKFNNIDSSLNDAEPIEISIPVFNELIQDENNSSRERIEERIDIQSEEDRSVLMNDEDSPDNSEKEMSITTASNEVSSIPSATTTNEVSSDENPNTKSKSNEKTNTNPDSFSYKTFVMIKHCQNQLELDEFFENKYAFTRVTHSHNAPCTLEHCKNHIPHKMRYIKKVCNCKKDSCKFQIKILKCEFQDEFFIYKKSTHKGKLSQNKRTRGISKAIKQFIINIIKHDSEISPKTILRRILSDSNLINKPQLKQVQNVVFRYRNKSTFNSIQAVQDLIKKNQFYDNIDENRPFFFNVDKDKNGEILIGNGSDERHLHICLTSLELLKNLDSNLSGSYHIDGTYKLIRNRFPLLVFGRTDMDGKFHLIALCITSHEKECDFLRFYNGLKNLAEDLGIEFDPGYIVQDACDASYNAAKQLFPDVEILMCYFHVVLNCKKQKHLIPQDLQGYVLKKCLRRLHMTTSKDHLMKYYNKFIEFCSENCPDFARYLFKSWLSKNSKYTKWKVYNSPPGYATTNSPIESFNASIKRDFTYRKKLSVFGFILKSFEIIKYYSVTDKHFENTPIPSIRAKNLAKSVSKWENFSQISKYIYEYKGYYSLNSKNFDCDCKYYLKWGYCSHQLALRNLFNEKEFVNKSKKGRPKNSEKWCVRE